MEDFIRELEDLDEKDQPLFVGPSPHTPKDPGPYALFSSFQEATEWFSTRLVDARTKWFGYQVKDPIKVIRVEEEVVLIQGIPYYTHTRYLFAVMLLTGIITFPFSFYYLFEWVGNGYSRLTEI